MLLNGIRADVVPEVMPLAHHVLHIEAEIHFLTAAVEVMENAKPLRCIQFRSSGTKGSKLGTQLCTHTGEVGSGFRNAFFTNGYRHILLLNDAVAGSGFVHDDSVVFLPKMIQPIPFHVHQNRFFKVFPIQMPVVYGNLGGSAAVQTVHQSGVAQKHLSLGRFRCHHVIDVGEFEGFGIAISHKEDTITPNPPNGNHILHPAWDTVTFTILPQNFFNRFHAVFWPPFHVLRWCLS